MEYVLEFYYQGDCLEVRNQNAPWILPNEGENIRFIFENEAYTESFGSNWVVESRRFLFHGKSHAVQTIQLICIPASD